MKFSTALSCSAAAVIAVAATVVAQDAEPITYLARVDLTATTCEAAVADFKSTFVSATVLDVISTSRTCIIKYSSTKTADEQTLEASISVSSTYEDWLDGIEPDQVVGFADTVESDGADDEQALHKLQVTVEEEASGSVYSWNLDRLDQESPDLDKAAYYPGPWTGEGVNVFVLDTGVNADHVEFADGRVVHGPLFNTDDGEGVATDLNGHGTHVASLVAGRTVGVAQKATITSLKVANQNGVGMMSDLLSAVQYVINNTKETPAILSISLAGAQTDMMDDMIAEAVDQGNLVVVAAGNSKGDACDYSPAAAPEAITIGASTLAVYSDDDNSTNAGSSGEILLDMVASFSNTGSCVDGFAPGVSIEGASATDNEGYVVKSGTSMATPQVAGVLALLFEKYEMDRTSAVLALQDLALQSVLPGTEGTITPLYLVNVAGLKGDSLDDGLDEDDDDGEDEGGNPVPGNPPNSNSTAAPSSYPVTQAPTGSDGDGDDGDGDDDDDDDELAPEPVICTRIVDSKADNETMACFDFMQSTFGPRLEDFSFERELVKPPAKYASFCREMPEETAAEFADKVVLVKRGYCEFAEKVRRAQAAGARAVIFYRNDSQNTLFAPGTATEDLSEYSDISIPSVLVTRATANVMKQLLPTTFLFGEDHDLEDATPPNLVPCAKINTKAVCKAVSHCTWGQASATSKLSKKKSCVDATP